MTRTQFEQEVAFLTILCGSKGLAEATVLMKNGITTPPIKLTEEDTNE